MMVNNRELSCNTYLIQLGITMIFWLCSPMFSIAAHHGGGGRPTSRRDGAEVAAFIRMEEKV